MIYLVDLDGTVANLDHRLHLIKKRGDMAVSPEDWTAFFDACVDDTPIQDVLNTVELLWESGAIILWVTGRSHACYAQTVVWLNKHTKIPPRRIYMRKDGDHRQDNIVKGELLDMILKEYPFNKIWGVFEDRQQVVDMYRARGLRVFQVAQGNF